MSPGGKLTSVHPAIGKPSVASVSTQPPAEPATPLQARRTTQSSLAGNVFKVVVGVGDEVQAGDVLIVLEAMKMEMEVVASEAGKVAEIHVEEGGKVEVDDPLVSFA